MATQLGKNLRIAKELDSTPGTYTLIANARTDKFTVNNAPIDVTDKDGMPWKKLIDGGVKSLSIDCTGVFTDAAILAELLGDIMDVTGKALCNFRVTDQLGNKWQGQFYISSLDMSGEYNKEEIYTWKLESANTITFTPHP